MGNGSGNWNHFFHESYISGAITVRDVNLVSFKSKKASSTYLMNCGRTLFLIFFSPYQYSSLFSTLLENFRSQLLGQKGILYISRIEPFFEFNAKD